MSDISTIRIKNLSTTATSAADDDYVGVDGATNGMRKLLVSNITAEVEGEIGTLSELTTDDQSDLVSAINEVDANVDANTADIADLTSDLSEANDAITDITGINNLIDSATLVSGYFINASGTLVSNSTGAYYENIAVESGKRYRFGLSSLVATSNTIRVHGYNSSDEWVQQLFQKTTSTISESEIEYVIPDGIESLRISLNPNQSAVRYIYALEDLQTQVSANTGAIAQMQTVTDLTSSVTTGGYITNNVDVGSAVDVDTINSNSAWVTMVIPVSAGDTVLVTSKGGTNARSWAITDSSYALISKADSGFVYDALLHAEVDGYVVVNADKNYDYSFIHTTTTIKDDISDLQDAVDTINSVELTNWAYGYIINKGTVGSVFDGIKYTYANNWRCQLIRVTAGETYYVTSSCGASAVSYALFNDSFECLEVSSSSTTIENQEVTITEDGFMIANALTNSTSIAYSIIKSVSADYSMSIPTAHLPALFESVSSVTYDSSSAYTYDEIIAGYDSLVTAYPDNITKTELGTDASGSYTIYRYDFVPTIPTLDGYQTGMGAETTADTLPTIFMDACIHGGEKPCARALLNLMDKIYTSQDNSLFAWLRTHAKFIIIPVANPYGYENSSSRCNYNGVDLNRNFRFFWEGGSSDTTSSYYRGTEALSEEETQYINTILLSLAGNENAMYYSWHTHGVFTSGYEYITNYAYPLTGDTYAFQRIVNDLIPCITESGHANHELDSDSGYIGIGQVVTQCGSSPHQATAFGIKSACPEVMYKYYDGTSGTDWSTNINCMNVEYMLLAVTLGWKYWFES